MDYLLPPALSKGDTIGIIAPSSFIESDRLDAGVAILKDHGFKVHIHPQTLARHNQSAGTPAEKAAALHEVFINPDVKAVIAAGGGNRAAHVLSHIDFNLLRANPKIYMGFSDSTMILAGLAAKSGMISFHGPVVKSLNRTASPCLDFTFGLLSGKLSDYPLKDAIVVKTGEASGHLIGGNLSVISALVGTGYLPDTKGAILFLEETNEEISRIDRTLWHLRQSLPFHQLAGIVFGQFTDPLDTGRPFGFTVEDVLREHTADLDIPVIMNAPFGHGEALCPLPVGLKATLTASSSDLRLKLAGPAVLT